MSMSDRIKEEVKEAILTLLKTGKKTKFLTVKEISEGKIHVSYDATIQTYPTREGKYTFLCTYDLVNVEINKTLYHVPNYDRVVSFPLGQCRPLVLSTSEYQSIFQEIIDKDLKFNKHARECSLFYRLYREHLADDKYSVEVTTKKFYWSVFLHSSSYGVLFCSDDEDYITPPELRLLLSMFVALVKERNSEDD